MFNIVTPSLKYLAGKNLLDFRNTTPSINRKGRFEMFSFIPYFILQAIYNIHIEIVFNAINRLMHSMMLITKY